VEIVNPVDPDDLTDWSTTLQTTFLAPPDPKKAKRAATSWARRLEPTRTWGARDHGRFVATLATDARTVSVPAAVGTRDLRVDALTGVTVNATHRRRGLLTTMLTTALAAARERGDALSYLVAAEWPIYGRFGYAPATRFARHTFHSRAPGSQLEPAGSVRQLDAAEFAKVGPAVGELARRARPGGVDRLPWTWESQLEDEPREGRLNLIAHEGAAGVDGVLTWQPVRDFELGDGLGAIEVVDLLAAGDEAYQGLWAYLSGMDVVEEVRLPHRPVDEPIRYLLRDGRTLQTTYVGDFTWACLLDVPAALTARGYPTSGQLVLDVVDTSLTGYAAGRWLLEVSPDGATCTPTTRSADLTVPARALAAAYFGDYPLAATRLGGGYEERTPGAARRFDLLFSTPETPFCATGF